MSKELTIGRLAKAADVNVETIRFYQRRGLMDEPCKPLGGYRRYAPSAASRVRFIKRAQQLGFTLEEVTDLLRLEDGQSCRETRLPSVQAQATPVTIAFEYTGGPQSWVVPPGVTEATFDVFGAQGGDACFEMANWPGGAGGRATATLPVTAGSTVTIMVGGKGADCIVTDDPTDCPGLQGGFNGGGNGGNAAVDPCLGQGGGGASDVRFGGAALTDRVLVAGGGGGAAYNLDNCNNAGTGGGLVGGSGQCDGGGSGGNQDGTSGSGQLGVGGNGADSVGEIVIGSGGGGGYYGGAGGQSARAGGGGSGFGPPGTVFANGVQAGHGRITVTFTPAPPTVTHISPSSGTALGGTVVTITGTNFLPGFTAVTFGGAPGTAVSCASFTTCTATSPPGNGTVSVRVSVAGQQSPDTPSDDFTYIALPTITAIDPSRGPAGTVVTIIGTGFDTTPGVTVVDFGPYLATEVSCLSTTRCTAVSPPNGAGPQEEVQLDVANPHGTSNAAPYLYVPDLALTTISPTSGPAAGGTVMTFTGRGFESDPGALQFFFGEVAPGRAATGVSCTSDTQCTGTSPPGTGIVTVFVVTVESGIVPGPTFTYLAPPGEPPPPAAH